MVSVRTTPLTWGCHRLRPESSSGGTRCDAGHRRDPAQRIGPGDDLEPAVFVLGQRRAAFHPVAAIHVADAVLVTDGGVMDVAADHPVGAVPPRFAGQRLFEGADIVDGVLD